MKMDISISYPLGARVLASPTYFDSQAQKDAKKKEFNATVIGYREDQILVEDQQGNRWICNVDEVVMNDD